MIRQLLVGAILLLCGSFSQALHAQALGSIGGSVFQRGTQEGIPEVAIALCRDTGNEVIVTLDGVREQMPPREAIREIRITNVPGGAPAQISIRSSSPECANPRQATTDRTGRFDFGNVPPGPYKLHARKTGFIAEGVRYEYSQVVTQIVSVAPGQAVNDISLLLTRGGVITGAIRDLNGIPVSSATVQAVSRDSSFPGLPVASGQTDDRGQYRLFGLPPGEFQVVVRPINPVSSPVARVPETFATRVPETIPNPRYAITYHPSETDKEAAKVIELREGVEIVGIDILLRPAQSQ